MNGILYMDVSVFEDVLLYEKGKTLLSAERRMYIEKLKNPKTARLSLGAGVLLFFALQKCNYTEQLEKIKKTPLGKPYLKGIDFQFNLSHSGTYALCAYSNRNIGADLQQIKEKLPEKTEKILSKDETSFLTKFTQPEQTQLFYRLWARKESLIKWDGRGLRLPLQEISFIKSRTVRGSDYQLYIVFLGKSNFLTVFTCKFTHCMQKSRFFRVFSLFSLEISVLLYTVFMNTPFFWFLCKKCFTSFCTHCIIHR